MRIAASAAWSPYPGRITDGPAAPVDHAAALPPAGLITAPGFDTATEVGPKGIRSMDRATAFAVSAAGKLLDGASGNDRIPDADRARTGLVIATTAGSLKTILRFGADSLTKPKPYQVDPGAFPVAVMNYAPGQCAIRHRVTGPNTAIRGGRAAMAQALRYSRRLLASGRVDQILCGATEEATPERAWLEHAARPAGAEPHPVGEGCVMLRLTADDAPGPRIAAVATQLSTDPATALEGALRRAVASGGTPELVVPTASADGHGGAETKAIHAVLGRLPEPVDLYARTGDTSAATLGFALLAALETAAPGTAFALTAIDRTGLACCVIGTA
jgi:3-oxoacyl-[acyl-carrier-protein] synthase II